MTSLKIKRVNRTKFQVKDGDKVVRECSSFKEAMDAIFAEDMILLDNLDEFCNTDLDDLTSMEFFNEAA